MKHRNVILALLIVIISLSLSLAFSVKKPTSARNLSRQIVPEGCVEVQEFGIVICYASVFNEETPTPTETTEPTVTETETSVPSGTATETTVPSATDTITPSETATHSHTETFTPSATTEPSITPTAGNIAPFVSAPLCPDVGVNHDVRKFHTLWDASRGCHYDHEHGTNPFTVEVQSAFPAYDLRALLGDGEVGSPNPTSSMENDHKHGGWKWNVQLTHPQGCMPFEVPNGQTWNGVNGSVVGYHAFGDAGIELESRIHSAVAMFRQCKTSNPNDFGYVFVSQHEDYGQMITPYQGDILPYPNRPVPSYPSPRGPYWSIDCIGVKTGTLGQPGHMGECRSSYAVAQASDNNSTVTAKVTGAGHSDTPNLFRPLWRLSDGYREMLWSDQTHPFTWLWLCSSDGGVEYNPVGCKKNNSTTQIHEFAGNIPIAWDQTSFDLDSRIGRVTWTGYVDQNGVRNASCTTPGGNCFPVKLVNAFTGSYGTILVFTGGSKGNNIVPYLPSRDICFNSSGTVVACESAGAIRSGWIGPEN